MAVSYAPATSVAPAAAAAPAGGVVAPPTSGSATALGASATFPLQLTITADPDVDVAVALSAISTYPSTTTPNVWILRAGGPPLMFAGPVNPANLYVLANGSAALISYVGQ
jgi:hypothetical protein